MRERGVSRDYSVRASTVAEAGRWIQDGRWCEDRYDCYRVIYTRGKQLNCSVKGLGTGLLSTNSKLKTSATTTVGALDGCLHSNIL